MSKTSSAGARQKNMNRMGNGASQTNPLTSKRNSSSVFNNPLSPSGNVSKGHSSMSQHASASGSISRGAYQSGARASVNGVRVNESLKRSQRMMFPNSLKEKDNLKFYKNEMDSKPFPGTKIEDMLKKWKGDYDKLEYDHQFIQWLFPLPEGKGLNIWAQPLQQHEAIAIQSDLQTKLRVLRAYRMMLDFYGMEIVSSDTGEVTRAKHYKERFQHLNRSMHNYRRITRIIKSIGYLGYGNLQAPFVKFLIQQACVEKTLPNLRGGSMHHWVDAIADEQEREETMKFFLEVNNGVNYFDDYDSVEFADEAMEDSGYNVDTGHFENACSLENAKQETGTGRNSDLSHSVGSSKEPQDLNSREKLKDSTSKGKSISDPTAPAIWT